MIKGSLRTWLLSSAVSVGLVATAGTAQAIEYNFGGLKLNLDTTVSAGVSVRTAETDTRLLSSVDGGPVAPVTATIAAGAGTATMAGAGPTTAIQLSGPAVVAGSTNSTDGRQNFDQGDLTSGIVKMTNDLSGSWQNYNFFARMSSYYDAVLSQDSAYARSALVDGEADAARDVRLLDLYVSGSYNVGDLPLNIRAGKQVISWGETTFMLNGINSINPIDVNAFRRPGSEVKEGLVPVWALDASIGLPYNLSLEAFYQLEWAPYQLDRAGTPFSTSDSATTGSSIYGNLGGVSYLTAGQAGSVPRNCQTTTNNAVSAAFTAGYVVGGNALRDCNAATVAVSSYVDQFVDYTNTIPYGMTEFVKNSIGDTGGFVVRDEDREAKDSGQWGVAARWYSEDLNNTEFGLYFMNYHSRLPFASERVVTQGSDDIKFTSYLVTSDTSSTTGRGTNGTGCATLAGLGAAGLAGTGATDPFGLMVVGADTINTLNVASTAAVPDPDGIYAAGAALAQAYYDAAAPNSVYATAQGGMFGADAITAINNLSGAGIVAINAHSSLAANIINCGLIAGQSTGSGLLQNGAEIVVASSISNSPALHLYLEYPEDIRLMGFSFNTTVGTWGVQGEVSYRDNAPFQLDTDQITIAGLKDACILANVASVNIDALGIPDTLGGHYCGRNGATGAAGSFDMQGYVRGDMYTFDLGTTATYANSNPFIAMTGADLGILVTEFGMVYTPDAPNEGDFTQAQWGNVCTGGTDLPGGGALGLAASKGCRPDKASFGYVLLGQLQYNNTFGTALTLSPTVAFSHDVKGNTPAPYGNFREGRKSVSLQLNGSFQSAWRGGISYTNYFGDHKYNSAIDMDFAAVNISYAF